LSVQLGKQSALWVWVSVGTAVLVSLIVVGVAIYTIVNELRAPLLLVTCSFSIVVWLGALTYTAVWWIRRFINKAVKVMRKQLSDDLITVMNIKDVEMWRRAAAFAEPHLTVVPRGDVGN
jgi:hypothetical protein